jgi:vancomycin resistance protein YoaR
MSARRLLLLLGALVGGLVAIVVLASVAEHKFYSGRVLPGVNVEGVDVAGKKKVAAYDSIARLAADLDKTPIKVKVGTNQFTVEPSVIGYDVDVDQTAHDAVREGRDGNPVALVAGTFVRRVRPDTVPLEVRYDPARLEGLLDGWSNSINQGVVEGGLRFDGTKVVSIAPKSGTGIQRDEARARLLAVLRSGDHDRMVELPVGEVRPLVDQAGVEAAAARARALLASAITIDAAGKKIVIPPERLVTTLGTHINNDRLDLTIDTAKLRYVVGPTTGLETPAVDASFSIDANNVPHVVASKDGRGLDYNKLAAAILSGKHAITAQVGTVHPAHDTAWAQKLGIKRQVSSFTTNHPAGQPRVHNIHLAADILNNTVVEPGKTFSLNELLGPRTPEKGYVKAPILVEDGFGEDYGGGISQLTTTLFNAVFFGGYEDTEHSPHHFYITRYPMGREATINFPSVDLKFKDDTTNGVLIRTSYSATSITVTFYGDNDGRVVREEDRKILKTEPITDLLIPCPVKKATDDPNNRCPHLASGEREAVGTGETGYDVEFTRVITQPGKPDKRTRYAVHYPMLPNKYLVGGSGGPSTTGGSASTTTPKSTAKPPTKPTTPTTLRKR